MEHSLHLSKLKSMSVSALVELAASLNVEYPNRLRKHELIFSVLKARAALGDEVLCGGTLDVVQEGYGFLRSADASYLPGPDDVYVPPSLVRRLSLGTGDEIEGVVRPPRDGEKYFVLVSCDRVNGYEPESAKKRVRFENLTPLHPQSRFVLERDMRGDENLTGRVIDLIAPLGKGQRALIVAPPKSGKTVMLQHVANALSANHPKATLMVLLIDERPEEVTEMTRTVRGEVVASTFDEPPSRHVQVAEMVIEKAKRLVEHGQDVVILLDSITRLARAYNAIQPSSGRVLSGGVEANALQKPKRFFGAARNVEEGGSLTIVATALVDTGSRMDEVIYEEFKGTGNMELHLERRLAERRVYPAVNVNKSGTRREELLLSSEELQKTWVLRKVMYDMDDSEAGAFLVDKLKGEKSNAAFFASMGRK